MIVNDSLIANDLRNMDTSEFTDFAKATIDFVADYFTNLRNRSVLPDVEPGYLIKALPKQMPEKSEKWQEVLKDVEQYIMPGVSCNLFSLMSFFYLFASASSKQSTVAIFYLNKLFVPLCI